jgi:hypothetical protein
MFASGILVNMIHKQNVTNDCSVLWGEPFQEVGPVLLHAPTMHARKGAELIKYSCVIVWV